MGRLWRIVNTEPASELVPVHAQRARGAAGFPLVAVVTLFTALLAAAAAGLLSQTADAASRACPTHNIAAKNSKATLFVRVEYGFRELYACVPGRGSTTHPIFNDTYVPGTVSLNGWIASYGYILCDDLGTHCDEVVGARKLDDLFDRTYAPRSVDSTPFAAQTGYGRIGAVRSTTDLSVVWIACHIPHAVSSYKPPTRGPECVHAGQSENEVTYRNATDAGKARMLDHGKGIDPSSLTLHGRRFTWRHSGQLRTYTAPSSPLPQRTT